MTQPKTIYAHVRNLASSLLTNLFKMPLNLDLQAKCLRLLGNLDAEYIFGDLLRMRRRYRHKSRRK